MRKRLGAIILVTTMLLSSTANAESYSSNGSASMLIKTQVASEWEVTVPSATNFSTVDKQATYEIAITGDVADNSIIQVIPESKVDLTNSSSNEKVELTVTQSEKSWLGSVISETPITTQGTLIAEQNAEFGAGQWQGELNFDIFCIEEEDLTEEVYNTIRSLNFYGAGDSLMEGYLNNYEGVLDTLNRDYAINIKKDYSISGAKITKMNTNGIPDVQTQLGNALARIDVEGYTANTVIVFDGGGNDAIAVAEGDSSITFSNMDDQNKDIGMAFAQTYGAITARQEVAGVRAPIVYIIPKLAASGMQDANLALQSTIKNLQSAVAGDDRLIIIDSNEIIGEADLQDDGVHWKQSGYDKINKAIVFALYDYYN